MWNPWTFLRCHALGRHRWEPFSDDRDSGWRCRDCGEVILEREFIEQDHEPDSASPYWGSEARRRLDEYARSPARRRHETEDDAE